MLGWQSSETDRRLRIVSCMKADTGIDRRGIRHCHRDMCRRRHTQSSDKSAELHTKIDKEISYENARAI